MRPLSPSQLPAVQRSAVPIARRLKERERAKVIGQSDDDGESFGEDIEKPRAEELISIICGSRSGEKAVAILYICASFRN